MQPILVRNLEIADTRMGAPGILATKPADVYFYGHLGSYERTIQDLRRSGVQVWRYFNVLHAMFEAAQWIPQSFERFMFDLATEHDFWLRDRAGEIVRFRWYGEGPIFNMAAMPDEARRTIVKFINSRPGIGSRIYLDQFVPQLHQWMFLDRRLRIRDLADYGHTRWLRSVRELLRDLGWPERRRILTNGHWGFDSQKILVMYENADSGHNARNLTGTLRRWRRYPGTVLSINGRPQDLHARRVLEFWMREGGYLWAENEGTALHAWELLRDGRKAGGKQWPRWGYQPKATERRQAQERKVGLLKAQDARNRRGRSDG